MMVRMTGAEAIIECLRREGVEVIFGLPGGVLLPLYDALYSSELRHILVRHEQAAAHAADGYARATGRVGVCLATSGPGATNLVTGIATAYMDSVPIVAMTGQVNTGLIGKDAFQEADITGITMPITKHNYLIKSSRDIPRVFREAFYIARTGRPGPVLIDLPRDITVDELEFDYPEINLPGYNPSTKVHQLQIRRAAEVLMAAERPVIYAGGGVRYADAHEELFQLATRLNAPVTTTLMGMGCFPTDHPLSLGMLGMHGTKYANLAVQEADVLLAVGARFDDRVTGKIASFAPKARIIHIDVDAAEIGKNVRVDIPIVGDAKIALTELLKHVQQRPWTEWNEKILMWKKEYPLRYTRDENVIKPQFVIEKICELCPDAIIVTEVGQNQMWAAQFFKHKHPRKFITSGGLGTMGYGFPAAIGAKVGRPECEVIDIAGDGSFQMNIQELATAVVNDIPVKIAILNNGVLGMVRQWQTLFFGRRYSHTTLGDVPDFVKVAEAYGALGLRATKPSEVEDVLKEGLASDRPTVMDFIVHRDEKVSPMVPAGASLSEILELDS
ncbi:acetolactate synthase large subunit [Methanothrix sp.]|uniref:acetolactate synthase large subunit n=1 Tax=Methanothrix sp. TaxID=90426 RepID=UPI00257A6966|nr:acetolactate synthase large subunit [Methanothrix sp.]NPU88063.1 acetolactate synthase large subunit [Methanothrix sp.]HOK58023.1 acetolactate synthase large subunit [Methanothrix sp.]HOL43426.1 acetolactate synthase large subunit [Methanothrix sp.]HPO88556.1 acetolactate synthase large subunit [Methanothrix sp.]